MAAGSRRSRRSRHATGLRDRALAVSGSMGLTSGDALLEGRLPKTETGSWWVTARGTYYRAVFDRLNRGVTPGFKDLQFKVAVRPTSARA